MASCIAQSKASFISKLSIVLEESDKSSFWWNSFILFKSYGMGFFCDFIIAQNKMWFKAMG